MSGSRILTALACALCLALSCSCISMSYVPADKEKNYKPLTEEERSEIYYEESLIPGSAKERVLVGSAEASGSTSACTLTDIKNKLMDCARKHGANVVLVTEISHKDAGQVRSDQVKNLSSPTWTPADDSASNATAQRNNDLYMSGSDPDVPVYKITIKARFYRIGADKLAKEPLFLRSSGKSRRRTAPVQEQNLIRVQ